MKSMDITAETIDHTSLVAEALALPLDLKDYQISRQLSALFPDQSVLQGQGYSFDLDEFVAGGHCAAILSPALFQQFITSFNGLGEGLREEARNAWYEVDWQGERLQVILLTWYIGDCTEQHYWILAETSSIAKEFFLRVCEWAAEVRGEVLVFDEGHWQKSEALYQAIKSATFANLILPSHLKQEIQDDFAQFFNSREMYGRYGLPWKRGVLLTGPPGNGKTHTVKALLNWLGVPCLYVKSFKSSYGTDQRNIHAVFQRARQTTPCILVLEDLDSLITDRNRSFFLNELDGFAANTGIVVLATTNHPERLDPALVNRPSRFDRKYHFDLPAEAERYSYLRLWNRGLEAEMKIAEETLPALVAATEGFSFAYLKELFLSAMMRWISSPEKTPMEVVMAEQCAMLRTQMHAMEEVAPAIVDSEDEEDEE